MEKFLKICNLPQGAKYVPGINLKGQYLKEFGFVNGDFVRVVLEENQIVITKTDASQKISRMVNKNPALSVLIKEFDLIPV
jgi:glycine cleavage system aminomethyltransferase T